LIGITEGNDDDAGSTGEGLGEVLGVAEGLGYTSLMFKTKLCKRQLGGENRRERSGSSLEPVLLAPESLQVVRFMLAHMSDKSFTGPLNRVKNNS